MACLIKSCFEHYTSDAIQGLNDNIDTHTLTSSADRGDLFLAGAYTPNNPMHVSPRFSLGSRHELRTGDNTPGPLEYNPEKPRASRATSLHPRLKSAEDPRTKVPGPGAYSVGWEKVSSKPTSPAWSLRPRLDYNPSSVQGPGPGAYDGQRPFRSLSFSMMPRRSDNAGLSTTPGPGAYTPLRPKSGGAGFGIGDRFNRWVSPLHMLSFSGLHAVEAHIGRARLYIRIDSTWWVSLLHMIWVSLLHLIFLF